MNPRWQLAWVASTLLVTACGKPLGAYEVRDVRVVTREAVKRVEPNIMSDSQMLRVEFVSQTDLYEASDGGGEGLYVSASFCPYDDDQELYLGEPFYDDRSRYGRDPRTNWIEERRPIKNARTGQYAYTTYLAIARAAEPARPGRDKQIGYDLREQARDLCVRIEHPGYFITPSRSKVFKIPAASIRRALLNHPGA